MREFDMCIITQLKDIHLMICRYIAPYIYFPFD
jgi:hypothetical protein